MTHLCFIDGILEDKEIMEFKGKEMMSAQAEVLEFKAPVDISAEDALRGVWQDFAASIGGMGTGNYQNNDEMVSVLNHNMVLMHKLLLSSSYYRNLTNSSFRRLSRTKYWGWKSILEDSLGKVGLFSVYKNAPVPLHDHPNTHGVMLVIDGEVEIERYTLQSQYRTRSESGLVELDICDRKILKPFDIAWFSKDEGNIHALQATTDQCVMLKVQLPNVMSNGRSWYFPTQGSGGHETVQARRIMSRYL